jgi:hypothetical protein
MDIHSRSASGPGIIRGSLPDLYSICRIPTSGRCRSRGMAAEERREEEGTSGRILSDLADGIESPVID